MIARGAVLACLIALGVSAAAPAKTSHAGWPKIADGHLFKQSSNENYVKTGTSKSDEILGHHGSDTLRGGGASDVLWGDWDPDGQPTSQVDHIYGGAGNDFIYSSHGTNIISAGAGNDYVKMHFGHGSVDCGPGMDVLEISRTAQKNTTIKRCEKVTHKTLGY